jgi:hypothetical protein
MGEIRPSSKNRRALLDSKGRYYQRDFRTTSVTFAVPHQVSLISPVAPPPPLPPPAVPNITGWSFFPVSPSAHAPSNSDPAKTKTFPNAETPIRRSDETLPLRSAATFLLLSAHGLVPVEPLLPERVRAESNEKHPARLNQQALPKVGAMHLAHKDRDREIKLIGKW